MISPRIQSPDSPKTVVPLLAAPDDFRFRRHIRSNVIAKITVEFEDSRVVNVDPKTGHSLISLLDCGDQIAHIVAGRVSELVKLYWAIGQEYPELPKYLATIRKDTESFRNQPVGGTA